MSRLADLIAELCPDGVECQPLSELVRIRNGCDYKTLSSGNVPVYGSGGVMTHVSEALGEGPTVLIPRKGSLDNIFFVEGKFWTVDTIFYTEIASDLDPKFFYYKMKTMHLSQMNEAAGVPSMNQKKLGRILIPVPPLEVQREIVRILDQFTTLEAELEAELEARRGQYEYYRNHLLSYESLAARGPVEIVKLGDVAIRVVTGVTPQASNVRYYEGGANPWIRTQDVNFNRISVASEFVTDAAIDELPLKWVKANSVIVAISGASAGRSAILGIDAVTNQHCCNLEIDSKRADYRYVYYSIAARYNELRSLGRGARGDLNVSIIKSFEIPLPPVEQQSAVADLLDHFDALVNDISSGLPAEIEARRAQYEHYRDRLLSFPEKAVSRSNAS